MESGNHHFFLPEVWSVDYSGSGEMQSAAVLQIY